MSVERIDPDIPVAPHGYAHVTVATGTKLVCTSGQVGIDAEGRLAGEGTDYRAQAKQAAANLYAALAAAGASASDMVRLVIYVVRPTEKNLGDLIAGMGEAARGADAKPTATTLLGVTALSVEDAVIELEATALID